MVLVHCREGNPEAFKIYLCGKVFGVNLTIDFSNSSFPTNSNVTLNSGKERLFSVNAICIYLYTLNKNLRNEETVRSSLLWEHTYLSTLTSESTISDQLWSEIENLVTTDYGDWSQLVRTVFGASLSRVVSSDPLKNYSKLANFMSTFISDINYQESLKWVKSVSSIAKLYTCHELVLPSPTNSITQEADVAQFNSLPTVADFCNSSCSPLPVRTHPIKVEKGKKNILITTSLPYVNNVPHLGNIIGCVLSGDVFSRYCRLRGHNSIYICGTDEYGTATETKALEENVSPSEICAKYNKLHKNIYNWFNIDFDKFGRTTTKEQTEISQEIFHQVRQNGHLFEDEVVQLKCKKCNRFLADRFVIGTCPHCNYNDARGDQCDSCQKLLNTVELLQPKCKICGSQPVQESSKHLFLNLPEFQEKLEDWFEKKLNAGGVWSDCAISITRSWLKEGIKPRCITRDLKWGTPVPLDGYRNKVFYVWFDAPIGYISITATYTKDWRDWWQQPNEVTMYNFMAKDNVPFHAIIFPATLMGTAANYGTVDHLVAVEYLLYEGEKFSKSRGVGVFGDAAKDSGIDADIFRFYLLSIRPETQDSMFMWDDLMLKNNTELLNNLGNFINRALLFCANNFSRVVQPLLDNFTTDDIEMITNVENELEGYLNAMDQCQLREGLRRILNITRLGNLYVQKGQPWVLIKGTDDERRHAGHINTLAVNICCLVANLLHPYMPTLSQTILDQMQLKDFLLIDRPKFCCNVKSGHTIGTPKPLISKITQDQVNNCRARYGAKSKVEPEVKTPVNADDLEGQVKTQGDKVRQLKSSHAEKALIDSEVAILLSLKKELEKVRPSATTNHPSKGGHSKSKKKNKKN